MIEEEIKAACDYFLKQFGERAQLVVAIEEMSELIKLLCKKLRFMEFPQQEPPSSIDVNEEIADVRLMLYRMELLFPLDHNAYGNTSVDTIMEAKVLRTVDRIIKDKDAKRR